MYASVTSSNGSRLYYSLDGSKICMSTTPTTNTVITSSNKWRWFLGNKIVGVKHDKSCIYVLSTDNDCIPATFWLENGFLRATFTTRFDGRDVVQTFTFSGINCVNPDGRAIPDIFAFVKDDITTVDKPVRGGFWLWFILVILVIVVLIIVAIVFSATNPGIYNKAKSVVVSKLASTNAL